MQALALAEAAVFSAQPNITKASHKNLIMKFYYIHMAQQ